MAWTWEENKALETELLNDAQPDWSWEAILDGLPEIDCDKLAPDITEMEVGLFGSPCPAYKAVDQEEQLSTPAQAPCRRASRHRPKKKRAWTQEEHRKFLIGLHHYGKGAWTSISRNFVKTRLPSQVASHAQKYFKRKNLAMSDRKRASIFDITNPAEHSERQWPQGMLSSMSSGLGSSAVASLMPSPMNSEVGSGAEAMFNHELRHGIMLNPLHLRSPLPALQPMLHNEKMWIPHSSAVASCTPPPSLQHELHNWTMSTPMSLEVDSGGLASFQHAICNKIMPSPLRTGVASSTPPPKFQPELHNVIDPSPMSSELCSGAPAMFQHQISNGFRQSQSSSSEAAGSYAPLGLQQFQMKNHCQMPDPMSSVLVSRLQFGHGLGDRTMHTSMSSETGAGSPSRFHLELDSETIQSYFSSVVV